MIDAPRSSIDQLLENAANRHKQQEIQIENQKEYQLAVNRVFSTNEGKLLAKYLLKHSGVFNDDEQLNPAKLIEDKGRRSYYLKLIRPYLDQKLRMEIENL
jgi:hypothetical protein